MFKTDNLNYNPEVGSHTTGIMIALLLHEDEVKEIQKKEPYFYDCGLEVEELKERASKFIFNSIHYGKKGPNFPFNAARNLFWKKNGLEKIFVNMHTTTKCITIV